MTRRRQTRKTRDTLPLPPSQPGYLPPDGHDFWRAGRAAQEEFLRIMDQEATLDLPQPGEDEDTWP
jgi:hypothetical protein